MLTYKEWKTIKDWVDYIIAGGSAIVRGTARVFLIELGIAEWVVDILLWLVFKAIEWGVGWLIGLIPHEAEDGVGMHKGDMKKLQSLGTDAPSLGEIKQGAKTLPLVPLKPALKDRKPEGDSPADDKMKPLDPAETTPSPSVPSITAMPVPPFGTGFKPNLSAKHAHYADVLKADLRSYHMDRLKRTAPYVWNGSPVAGAPAIGFIDAQKIYKRSVPTNNIYPNYVYGDIAR